MSPNPQPTLDEAIAAARAGRRDEATRMLRQLVADDPFNANAWVWLGGLASDPAEQRRALEQALRIAPADQRAQRGLDALRRAHPQVFESAAEDPAATRPLESRSTPSYEQQAAPLADPTSATLRGDAIESRAAIYPAADAQPRVYDAPTQAMPAQPTYTSQPAYPPQPAYSAQPAQTDRMAAVQPLYPEQARSQPFVDRGGTDRMAVPPAPATIDTAAPAERPATGANVARWLLVLLWLFSFGAVATLAGAIIYDPAGFAPTIEPALGLYGFQLVPSDIQTTAFGTTLGLVVLAVVDLIVALGLMLRARWAWVVNLLFALLVTAGTITTAILFFSLATLWPNRPANVLPALLVVPTLVGLGVFTLIYLWLSLGSRRAFFRRRTPQTAYGR